MTLPEASGVTLGFSGKARVTTGLARTLRGGRAGISTLLIPRAFSSGLSVSSLLVPHNQGNFFLKIRFF